MAVYRPSSAAEDQWHQTLHIYFHAFVHCRGIFNKKKTQTPALYLYRHGAETRSTTPQDKQRHWASTRVSAVQRIFAHIPPEVWPLSSGACVWINPFCYLSKMAKNFTPSCLFFPLKKSFAHFDPGVVILGVKESENQCRRSVRIWNGNLEAHWKARLRLEVCWGHVYDQCHLVWREGYCSHIASFILWRIFYQIFCLFVPQKKRLLTFPQQHSLKKLHFKARPFSFFQSNPELQPVTLNRLLTVAAAVPLHSSSSPPPHTPFLCEAALSPVTWWLNKLSLYCSCYRHHNVSRHPSTAPAVRGSVAQR